MALRASRPFCQCCVWEVALMNDLRSGHCAVIRLTQCTTWACEACVGDKWIIYSRKTLAWIRSIVRLFDTVHLLRRCDLLILCHWTNIDLQQGLLLPMDNKTFKIWCEYHNHFPKSNTRFLLNLLFACFSHEMFKFGIIYPSIQPLFPMVCMWMFCPF